MSEASTFLHFAVHQSQEQTRVQWIQVRAGAPIHRGVYSFKKLKLFPLLPFRKKIRILHVKIPVLHIKIPILHLFLK